MMKNMIQFQPRLSLTKFLERYETEEKCRAALYAYRWPRGFECPNCGHHSACKLHRRDLYQCNRCHHQSSVTAGTIFQGTKLPLSVWFLGIYFVTQNKNGISSLALSRLLGISQNAAWRMKHKLMQVMLERDDEKPFTGQDRDRRFLTGADNAEAANAAEGPRTKSPLWRRCKRLKKKSH